MAGSRILNGPDCTHVGLCAVVRKQNTTRVGFILVMWKVCTFLANV